MTLEPASRPPNVPVEEVRLMEDVLQGLGHAADSPTRAEPPLSRMDPTLLVRGQYHLNAV